MAKKKKVEEPPLETLRQTILKLLEHEHLTARGIARLTHASESQVRSVLAAMTFTNKEVCCKRHMGLDVYYIGAPPEEFFTIKDSTGHNVR